MALCVIAAACTLSPLRLFASDVVISEFMAANGATLLDGDSEASDWIEVFNARDVPVSLAGWTLSDDPSVPQKWTFPEIELGAQSFLVVFASGKDRRDPAAELHTNFKLSRSGEYLALYDPLVEVATAFAPEFPEQRHDASFGTPMQLRATTVLDATTPARILVPMSAGDAPDEWVTPEYNDFVWMDSTMGVGYDQKDPATVDDLIETDLGESMRGFNASLLMRVPFVAPDLDTAAFFRMLVQLDGGFIAHLNGVEIARENAPARSSFRSSALESRPPAALRRVVEIPIPSGRDLLRPGENLLAIQVMNDERESPDLLFRPVLEVVVVDGFADATRFFSRPTPAWPNPPGGENGIARPPVFSRNHELFSGTFVVELASAVPQATIRYTVDGSDPDEFSALFSEALTLDASTHVIARAFEPGMVPSDPVRASYLAVDPAILEVDSDLPLVVLSTFGKLISPGGNSSVAVHVRVVGDAGGGGRVRLTDAPSFVGDGAIKTRGSTTLSRPKKSYGLELRDVFGDDLDAEILGMPAESDWVFYGPHQDTSLLRNAFIYEVSRSIGRYAARTRFCEVYLSQGQGSVSAADYVGLYVLMEKIKRGEERVDVEELRPVHATEPEVTGGYIIKRDRPDPGDLGFEAGGDTLRYVEPKEREITSEQKAWLTDYIDRFAQALEGPEYGYDEYIDVGSWIDHHLLNEFTINPDGFEHSTYMFKRRGGKLEAGPIWDFNLALGFGGSGPVGWSVNRFWIWWGRLLRDPAFQSQYKLRWRELRGGPMATDALLAVIDRHVDTIREAQARNFGAWPESEDADGWDADVEALKLWVRERVRWMDSDVLAKPVLSPEGGRVERGIEVSLSADEGQIYYTIDGSDPRGELHDPGPTAILYDAPIVVDGNTLLQARVRIDTEIWSGTSVGTYITDPLTVAPSEIMYNPTADPAGQAGFGPQDFEFIELVNFGGEPVDLRGSRLGGTPSFEFSDEASILEPGAYVVLVRNLEAFTARYGDRRVAGEYSGFLGNNQQELRFRGILGETVFALVYDDGWYPSTDGEGHSLVLVDPTVSPDGLNDPSAWRASHQIGGSPGRADAEAAAHQRIGDLDQDARLTVTDAIRLLLSLQGAVALPCGEAGNQQLLDVDGTGKVDLSDGIHLLQFLFRGSESPLLGGACREIPTCPDVCLD